MIFPLFATLASAVLTMALSWHWLGWWSILASPPVGSLAYVLAALYATRVQSGPRNAQGTRRLDLGRARLPI